MRPHGRANISDRNPRALAICDRCQFMVNHDTLRWQMQWRGPRLQNIRLLVCPACYDTPQEQLRTIVLPPDPVSIANARPENYALDDNPVSYLGFDPANSNLGFDPAVNVVPGTQLGMNIGTLTQGGGVNAAFDGVVQLSTGGTEATPRRLPFCAQISVSDSSFGNWVGKNWAADASGMTTLLPSTVAAQTHVVSSFSLVAPSDQSFLASGATSFVLDGSDNGVTWSTIYSGTTAGTAGEVLTASTTAAIPYQYHRIAFLGDGTAAAIAQAILNISDAGQNEV